MHLSIIHFCFNRIVICLLFTLGISACGTTTTFVDRASLEKQTFVLMKDSAIFKGVNTFYKGSQNILALGDYWDIPENISEYESNPGKWENRSLYSCVWRRNCGLSVISILTADTHIRINKIRDWRSNSVAPCWLVYTTVVSGPYEGESIMLPSCTWKSIGPLWVIPMNGDLPGIFSFKPEYLMPLVNVSPNKQPKPTQ